MTALAKDKDTVYREGVELDLEVAASTTLYAGAGICVNAAGYAVPAADTADFKSAGVAQEQVDNSAGAAGDKKVTVRRHGLFKFVTAGLTIANIGDDVFWVDDQTVALAATTTNDVPAGKIAGFISATAIWVDIAQI